MNIFVFLESGKYFWKVGTVFKRLELVFKKMYTSVLHNLYISFVVGVAVSYLTAPATFDTTRSNLL